MPSFGTLVTHGAAFLLGAIVTGYVVANNKDKAFAALAQLHEAAKAEIAKLRGK